MTVQRADDRFHTKIDWLDSWHSFNFGGHYRPGDDGHGLLLVNNDDTVAPGGGLRRARSSRHGDRHVGAVGGTLEHHDSTGNHGVLYPGSPSACRPGAASATAR